MQEKRFFQSTTTNCSTFLYAVQRTLSILAPSAAADVAVADASVTLVLVSVKDVFAVVDRSETALR